METSTEKFLKKCAKLKEIQDNPRLKLHFKSHLKDYEQTNLSRLYTQNEHFKQNQNLNSKVDGKIECNFCYKTSVPKFKVQRIRKNKKMIKKSVFQCPKCKKQTIAKEILPQQEKVKSLPVQIEPKKPEKKKKKTSGLNIPTSMLKNALNSEETKSQSRLERMLKS